ncbi:SpoIIE family protein phosphatase [Streptomyces sp. HB132]|uniref:ATP-binding SpoIIE family protein phosphatase n=1 Tax=Streptomyces sp. HB132 TaxID=767388 RepID=UPI00195FFD60|nr:SpoIIE family protein phosphatase [Streptomyces sp. HB132]MBM7438933.1 GAF domain-containing protein/anti-sigma regulatory factor (Ser/Thr protein kinase)/PAS domain-containing protein [Streptomyces sp. HB132]
MADAPLMVVDGAGVVTGWSRAAERRFGPATADALGLRLMDVLANDNRRAGRGEGTPPGLRLEPLAGGGWAVWSTEAVAGRSTDGDVVEAALLNVMFTQARVRVHVLDPELRVLRINDPPTDPHTDPDPAETERLRGRPFREVCAFDEPDRVETFIREVLRTGVPGVERLFRTAAGDVPGRRRALSLTAFRLQEGHGVRQSDDGRVLGVAVSMVDVSAEIRRRGRDAALAAVRDNVGRTLDVDATCRDLVEALVPGYADVGVIEVVDAVLRGETPEPGPLDLDVPLRRAAYGGSNRAAHPVGDIRAVVPGTPYQRALSDRRIRVLPLADAAWADADAARVGAIRHVGAHTLLVAPLTVRGAVLGLVSLYRCGDSEPFDEGDIPVVAAMASRAALGIDNARRYVHEFTIASALQRRLLPQHTAPQPAVEADHLMLPGGDAGHWFDTIALSGARTAFAIGEVAERGIHAATTMGQLRTVVHALAALDLEPDELVARLYDTAARLAAERAQLPHSDPLHKEPLAASCAYAVYDPFTETCTIASAGHPAPLVVEPDGAAFVVGLPVGPPLGTADRAPVAAVSVPLTEGSLIVLHSNALRGHAQPTSGALRQALMPTDRPMRDLCDAVARALPDSPELRGAALLLARTHAMPEDRYAAWELPYDKTAPATARRLTSKTLAEWHLEGDTGDATELIVSELVTNAVRYGSPPLKLRLILDRGLTCEIRDGSTTAPYMKYAGVVDEGGRGLFIISQLASLWGTRFAAEGKTVWSEQAIRGERA